MLKLKKIIHHLDEDLYSSVEDALVKNKAENFLYLLQSYRKEVNDDDIISHLGLTNNSFYVLKSRLYDKIQEHLSGDINVSREELLKKLSQVDEMCFKEPREMATAYLQKLERDLLEFDMHNELLVVYSALKKLHLYSEKYFHYSQLYNKHIAFSLSLEKSEEILGNFNRVLGQYDFSRSTRLLETLAFIRKEINDHYILNPSRQVEIIRNFIEIQFGIFCKVEIAKEIGVEELLKQTDRIIGELPDNSPYKSWTPALHYLFFAFYVERENRKSAQGYYVKLRDQLDHLLLYSNIAMVGRFLVYKLAFENIPENKQQESENESEKLHFDAADIHTSVLVDLYEGMRSFRGGNHKEAANKLNKILNENSFKDFFHVNADIKLTLAYIYIQLKEYNIADSIIKGIYRKIKAEKISNYANVLDIIKVFELEMKRNGGAPGEKQKDAFTLFSARNKNENELLVHLFPELKQKYS